ncbi:MAG: CoB--CoM heterodisulfide reductase iron-sulfur subunit A family protein [Bacteroidetes bacterium]|nr:CoB--CoM heterodisulfide reductase iron-sulfur subunit A family protein [Bacteroidota bacterium]
MPERIGAFICECGPNIKDAIDIESLTAFALTLDSVVIAKPFSLLCSGEGGEFIRSEIAANKLTRVVIASCSPKEHEETFRNILAIAGLNPFLLQVVNIREQCAWTISDKYIATEKAKMMLAGGVRRVVLHEPLEVNEIDCNADVLVLGAGIAGITAALNLAGKNRKVYLVEKQPSIGGRAVRYEKVFPNMECGSCMIQPLLNEVMENENIRLFTYSEVVNVKGYLGNFVIQIKSYPRFVDISTCIGCGICSEACPVRTADEYSLGLRDRSAVYIPAQTAVPHIALIDRKKCLHFIKQHCKACIDACPFGSINLEDSEKIIEISVGAVVIATGFDLFDIKKAPQYGYGAVQDVFSSLEFEMLLNSGGNILTHDGRTLQSIALIHCVGSRNKKHNEYCSGICCMNLLKIASLLRKQLPDVQISDFYIDMCLPGKEYQAFFNEVRDKGRIDFVRLKAHDSLEITGEDNRISLKYQDEFNEYKRVFFDMVILGAALKPSKDSPMLAQLFDIKLDENGFFRQGHPVLSPVSVAREGIYTAGCARGPMNLASSVVDALAATGKISNRLVCGVKIRTEPLIAEVIYDNCSGCNICTGLCPYGAIDYDAAKKTVSINEVLCQGCGICVSACPSGAVKCRHYTDRQISAEIEGLLNPGICKKI